MPNENNKFQVDIENLFKQNVNDLASIKELYRKLKEMEDKISQIKYIDSQLANKLKKEYESLKKQILDENAIIQLDNKIDTTKSSLESSIKKNETKLEENINNTNSYVINPLFPPEGYEGISESKNDNKNALENLLKNFKNITLPKGKFYISSLEIPSNATLKGSGKDTILISTLNNSNVSLVFTSDKANRINIENLCIDGNNQNLTVLNINRSNGVFEGVYDCNHFINDVILLNGNNGLTVNGYVRASDFNRIIIQKMNKNGLEINTTDCSYNTFNISECGEKAVIISKNNNRISNIKAYVNGYSLVDSYSFYINSDGNTLNNIEIQDASYNGIQLKGSNNKLTNLFIDGCGYTSKVNTSNAISLKVEKRSDAVFSCFNLINGVIYNGVGNSYGKYGLFVNGNECYFNNINMLISDNKSKLGNMPVDFSLLKYDIVNFTNSIVVNNETENYVINKINDSTTFEKVDDIKNVTIGISNGIMNFNVPKTIGITKGYSTKALINVLTEDIGITSKKTLTVRAKFKTNNKNVLGTINFFIRESGSNKFVTIYGSNLYKALSSEYQDVTSCLDLTKYSNIETLKICLNITKSDEIETKDEAICSFKDICYSLN